MINDANTQRNTTEKISTTPTLERTGILVTRTQETSSLSDSRIDGEELDHTLVIDRFSEVSSGLNASTISAAEKSFKREDYIYVSFFFFFFCFRIFKIMVFSLILG